MNESESEEVLVFNAALDLPSPAERAAYLDEACAGNAALRRRVEALLRIQAEADAFFESGESDGKAQPGAAPLPGPNPHRSPAELGGTESHSLFVGLTERPGDTIGRYTLLENIGEGGFGVVYMAEQREPLKRRVALKIIKLGMDTRQVVARFEAERQALALMDHPNIAKVFDAGATESGRPYFVMELVRGVPITQYGDEHNLPTVERLGLFAQVCRAIQHAHQKGIIHRDVKPSNILVTLHDGVPVPKVIDFGIAKATQQELTEKTAFTQFHQFIGTPAYMSPEQAELSAGPPGDIDTRSDIYSLGVLLYELLTGKTPFDSKELLAAGLDEMRRIIREKEPVRPSTRLGTMADAERTTMAKLRQADAPKLIHLLSGDLDWIVMKALEKDRTRRYETANGLAMDVERHLQSEPVIARPPSGLYRFQKLARRHRLALAAVAAVATALLLGAVASTWLAIRAMRAEREQRRALAGEAAQRRHAEQNLYAADMKQAKHDVDIDDLGNALELLNKHRPKPGQTGSTNVPGFEWRYLWQQCLGDRHESLPPLSGIVWWLEYSPDGHYLAAAADGEVAVFDTRSSIIVAHLEADNASGTGPRWAVFTPDGKVLITASTHRVRLFETTHWTEQPARLPQAGGPIAISSNGISLVTMQAGEANSAGKYFKMANIWNLHTLQVSTTLTNVDGPLAFSPDGKWLATDTSEGIKLWPMDTVSGPPILLEDSTNLLAHPSGYSSLRRSMSFSPDGRLIAAGGCQEKNLILLWNSATGRRLDNDQLEGHRNAFTCLTFSPDSRYLATSSFDSAIFIWDVAARKRVRKLRGHLMGVWSIAFAPDGENLASGGEETTSEGIKIWPFDRTPQSEEKDLIDRSQPGWISTNGVELVTFDEEKAEYWNTVTGQLLYVLPRPDAPRPPARSCNGIVAPDGRRVFAGYVDGGVRFGTFATGEIVVRSGGHTAAVTALAASPDGKMLVTGGRDARLCWWELPKGLLVRSNALSGSVTALAFSPDSRTLLSASEDLKLCWWDVASGRLLDSKALLEKIDGVLFSPDGKTLALGASGRSQSQLWDVATRSAKSGWIAHWGQVAFSPDGKALLVNGGPILFGTTDGKEIAGFAGHKQVVNNVAFSPDGGTVVTAGDDGTVRLWSTATRQEVLVFSRPGLTFDHALFSADGRTLVVGSEGPGLGGIRIWRAPSFAEIEVMEKSNRHDH